MASSYAFGDSDLAAERLELLADVFEPPSREFLEAAAPPEPAVALDLGCATGRTTRLVADATGAKRTIGVDSSEAFLTRAAEQSAAGVEYLRHDATAMPLPRAPANLIYARLLLAHLPDPEGTIRAWAEQLRPGGRLLLDENEYIAAAHPVLVEYERLVTEVVAARGASMHVGPVIAAIDPGDGWRKCWDRVATWPVAEPTAAQLYVTNLTTWRHDDYVTAHYPSATIDELADRLAAIATSPSEASVEWGIRQVAFERVA